MKNIVLVLLVISYFNCISCKLNNNGIKDKTFSKDKLFEYKNDTISQTVEIYNINSDTLKLNLTTYYLKNKISCTIEGIAVRDTVGDFLNEEETIQDENGEVFSVIKYRFVYKDTFNLLGILLERTNKSRLVYYDYETGLVFDKPYCLLNSVGTLREKVINKID